MAEEPLECEWVDESIADSRIYIYISRGISVSGENKMSGCR